MGYDVRGDGEPLLVLSGYGLAAASLRPVVGPLAARFGCITYDYPGCGDAPPPLWPLTIPGLAAHAVRLLDRLGHRSAHVLGISLGGMVAQELAIRFPERVRGLVLAATTAGGPSAVVPDPWTLLSGLSAAAGSFADGPRPRLRALAYQAAAASMHDTTRRLHRITARTLVLHGERDTLVPVENARLLHRGIPHSTLHVVPDAGHLYLFDEPEAAAARIGMWLENTGPPSLSGPSAPSAPRAPLSPGAATGRTTSAADR